MDDATLGKCKAAQEHFWAITTLSNYKAGLLQPWAKTLLDNYNPESCPTLGNFNPEQLRWTTKAAW